MREKSATSSPASGPVRGTAPGVPSIAMAAHHPSASTVTDGRPVSLTGTLVSRARAVNRTLDRLPTAAGGPLDRHGRAFQGDRHLISAAMRTTVRTGPTTFRRPP